MANSKSSQTTSGGFFKRYFIDAMGSMALGLFASLIIGLIISQLSKLPGLGFLSAVTDVLAASSPVIGSAIVVYYNTSDAVSVVDAIFESCSAFGTVGLSVGVTSQLNNGAKILYMLVMFMGRVGPVAFAMSLTAKPDDNKRKIMPVGHINVG